MFLRRSAAGSPPTLLQQRLTRLVRDTRDGSGVSDQRPIDDAGNDFEVMRLLVDLRAAGKRGGESPSAHLLGPEFARYQNAFYMLPVGLQPLAIQALLMSCRQEQAGDLNAAAETCERALGACPGYPPLLERLATLEMAAGRSEAAEGWYVQLLDQLERFGLEEAALEICRRLPEMAAIGPRLLERCAAGLELSGELALAARCWSDRAAMLRADGHFEDALSEIDRALQLQPDDARLHLELALIYESLEEVDRAAAAYDLAEQLAVDDPETLGRVLLIRARLSRPNEPALGRLLGLLAANSTARARLLEHTQETVAESPYNPHLSYLLGVVLAQDGQENRAAIALSTAIERYTAQADAGSELEARLALQRVSPGDESNGRRIAELYFARGEVHGAMQALAELARFGRTAATL